jgi:cellulase
MLKSSLLALATLASTVYGHGQVQSFIADGVWYQGYILAYYYDRVNKAPYPNVAGWYEEALDLGFVNPSTYQTSSDSKFSPLISLPVACYSPAG